MPSYQSYKKAWEKRNQEEAEHNRNRSDQARKDGRKIAEYLGKKYRVSQVFLFGSVLKEGDFNGKSDLDDDCLFDSPWLSGLLNRRLNVIECELDYGH